MCELVAFITHNTHIYMNIHVPGMLVKGVETINKQTTQSPTMA